MSKEIYISTTPHETRLAIVEDEQLAEIYYERENEYTLAGSIYNGKVTRVLPGMQSSFVDIGLERDAFLYVTDFMEEAGDAADFEAEGGDRKQQSQPREERSSSEPRGEGRGDRDRGGRGRGRNDRDSRPERDRREAARPAAERPAATDTTSFDEPIAPAPTEGIASVDAEGEERGSRRWRGRRGRRRGRGNREEQPGTVAVEPAGTVAADDSDENETVVIDSMDAGESDGGAIEIDLSGEPAAPSGYQERSRSREGRGGRRRGRDSRGGERRGERGGDRAPRESISPAGQPSEESPVFDNSYAGYYNEEALPEGSGEPIVLPGESIRKYRDPSEVAAEDAEAKRNAPPAPEVLTVSAPSIEIVGWDGGSVLPGETLGRHRNRGNAPKPAPIASVAVPAPKAVEAAPEPVAAEVVTVTETEAAVAVDPGALPAERPVAGEAAETVETEYEPTEGASASVTDTPRRDLRRFEQTAEPAPEPLPEAQGEEAATGTPDATTYDLDTAAEPLAEAVPETAAELNAEPAEPLATVEQAEAVAAPIEPRGESHAESGLHGEVVSHGEVEPNFTTLQQSGEMLSLYPDEHTLPLASQDTASANPIAHEEAVQSVTLAEAETTPEPVELVEEVEEGGATEIHAYGDGDFHEEEIEELDGDEYEYEASSAGSDEESEEYEEETLEGSTDLGSMLHEMSLDSQTAEEDEDDTEDASGGFTAEDFGGEAEEEEDAPAEGSAGNGEQRSRSGDRPRRGGRDRDRRGGRNSGGGERGRGRRQSMQTTDLPAINELLKPGQEILVQIAKEPIAKKGARITSHIALPGRFLVFMPTVNHTGVSRKISSDEERRRLKSILLSEKGDAQGGFIVRTAADGASEEELRNDLRFLIHLWNDIKQRSETSKSPALIYHDLNLVERILRDQVTDNFSAIWVDTEQEYERVLRFLQRFQPSLVRRVKLYTKETPLFEHFGVTAEIDKALKSKVWLKSGGSIVINQTEALVAIDINTGKYVGKTARLEDTILKTNLDAIPEIVRQIRLRDLGGIIVIDFIDMDERKNRARVLQALEDEMRADRAPSKILPFNDFGLVIMTRKRVKQSLERTLCIPDPITDGTGMIKSPVTVANEIFIEMRKMHRHLEKQDVMLRVHPEVVKTLKANGGKRLQELEEMTRKTILVKSDPALSPEAFDIH